MQTEPSRDFAVRSGVYLLSQIALMLTFGPGAIAQNILPDNPTTQVTPQGPQLTITGGTQAGANLFHSFSQFNLDAGQTASFQSNGAIANIFSRVTGGNASLINGTLQVQGGVSNLFLINPAGILFGTQAKLDLPAAFTATTANGIEFGTGLWLPASGTVDYSKLAAAPTGFGTTQSGAIANAADLAVAPNQSLTLVGGTVVNQGKLTAPGGTVTIAAVPGEKLVRISSDSQVLSLDLPLADKTTLSAPTLTPQQLPELLSGGNAQSATQMTIEQGQVRLSSGALVKPQNGDAIVSGEVSIATNQTPTQPAQINITGERIDLKEANIDASASFKPGKVKIGGDFLGQGDTPRAQTVTVDKTTQIHADATVQGNGGEIIIWSDNKTQFAGTATAKGGPQGGNGGKIETSAKQTLDVRDAQVNASAPQGKPGEWTLDPADITIANTGGTVTPGTIATTLDGGTDVNITTNVAGPGVGDITLVDNINQTGGGAARLNLTSRRFNNPGNSKINLTTTGGVAFNLNLVNPEAVAPASSIQNAVNAIGTGPTPGAINLAPGTYTTNTPIVVNNNVYIGGYIGGGVNSDRRVSGNNTSQVFRVGTTGRLTLDGLTVRDGNTGTVGGGVDNRGDLTIANSLFINNRAPLRGGAVHVDVASTRTIIDNSYFDGNRANSGGAISNNAGGATPFLILNSVFVNNNATISGGSIVNDASGQMTIRGSAISNSTAQIGGAIASGNNSRLTIDNGLIQGNTANYGGGIYLLPGSTLSLDRMELSNNTASNDAGGAIFADRANTTISSSGINNNTALRDGGAIYQDFGNLSITTSGFTGNTAARDGGAIDVFGNGARLDLVDTGFFNNVGGSGGAIFADPGTITTIRVGDFQGNQAKAGNRVSYDGGAIYNDRGTFTIDGARFIGNQAAQAGGALFNLGTVTLTNSTIESSRALSLDGGGIFNNATLSIRNSSLTNNQAVGAGGALYSGGGTLQLDVVNITGNRSDSNGGGLEFTSTDATITGSTISNNQSAYNGGGIGFFGSTVNLRNTEIFGNSATLFGGGVEANNSTVNLSDVDIYNNISSVGGGFSSRSIGGSTVIANSRFANNQANQGGGIHVSETPLSIADSVIQNNTATDQGGGLEIENSPTAQIERSLIQNNQALSQGGGGINVSGLANVSLRQSTLRQNRAVGNGGGLAGQSQNGFSGTIMIADSIFDQNEAGANGGGIDANPTFLADATLTIDRSTLFNNLAGADGGAISVGTLAPTILNNVTITQNRANRNGGGLNSTNGDYSLNHVTIANNQADADGNGTGIGGGIHNLLNPAINLRNTIVAANRSSGAADVAGAFVDQGNNLIGIRDGSSGFTTSTLVGSANAPINPLLAALGNYGGLTPTLALLPGSDAIDAGNSDLPADQRGIARVGAPDIGAFESRGFVLTPQSGNNQTAVISQAFTNPLQVGVSSLFNEPVDGGRLLFSAPTTGASATLPGSQPFAVIAQGQAQVPAIANDQVGSYQVQARINRDPIATFSLTNVLPPIPPTPPLPPITPPSPAPPLPPAEPPLPPSDPSPLPSPPAQTQTQPSDRLQINPLGDALAALDGSFSAEYQAYFQGTALQPKSVGVNSAQDALRKIQEVSGLTPAVIYAVFVPEAFSPVQQQLKQGSGMPNLLRSRDPQPNDRLELVMVNQRGISTRRSTTFTRAQVTEQMTYFRLINDDVENDRSFDTFGQQFYQWLLQPVEADLKAAKAQTLIYVLDEGLRSLPVASMRRLEAKPSWAIDDYGISVVPSLGLLDQRVKLLRNQSVLAMGAEQIKNQEALPAVPSEIEAIRSQFGSQETLLNEKFTYNNLVKSLRDRAPGILHMATHAEFNEGRPQDSAIYLWDRPLRLSEIRNLQLEQIMPELLVLSACNTASGNAEAELGFTGMAALSGVKTVLGSLWQVSDLGTLALMSEFYTQLGTSASRTDALRIAQGNLRDGKVRIEGDRLITTKGAVPLPKNLAQSGTLSFTHPYYWSGFTMVGNPW